MARHPEIPVTIRFPADLHAMLKKRATSDSPPSSFNSEVVRCLRAALQQEAREAALKAEVDRLQAVADQARSDFAKLLEGSAEINRRLALLEGK